MKNGPIGGLAKVQDELAPEVARAADGGGWEPLGPAADVVWRDDYASILPHLRWGQFL